MAWNEIDILPNVFRELGEPNEQLISLASLYSGYSLPATDFAIQFLNLNPDIYQQVDGIADVLVVSSIDQTFDLTEVHIGGWIFRPFASQTLSDDTRKAEIGKLLATGLAGREDYFTNHTTYNGESSGKFWGDRFDEVTEERIQYGVISCHGSRIVSIDNCFITRDSMLRLSERIGQTFVSDTASGEAIANWRRYVSESLKSVEQLTANILRDLQPPPGSGNLADVLYAVVRQARRIPTKTEFERLMCSVDIKGLTVTRGTRRDKGISVFIELQPVTDDAVRKAIARLSIKASAEIDKALNRT